MKVKKVVDRGTTTYIDLPYDSHTARLAAGKWWTFLDGALKGAAPYVAIGPVEEEVEVSYSGEHGGAPTIQHIQSRDIPNRTDFRVEYLPPGSFGVKTVRPYDRKTDPPLDYRDFMAKVLGYYDAHPADGWNPLLLPPSNRPASPLVAQARDAEATSPVNTETTAPAIQTPRESPDNLQVNARLVELEHYLTEKWDVIKSLLPPQATPGDRQAAGSHAENTFAQSEIRMIDVAFGLSRILSLPESSLTPELVKVRRRLVAGQWDFGLRTLSDLQETYNSYYDSHDLLIEAKLKNMDVVDRMNLLRLGVYIASQQGGEPYAELLNKLAVHPLKEAAPISQTAENRVVTVPAPPAPKQQSPGTQLDSNPQGPTPQAPSQVNV